MGFDEKATRKLCKVLKTNTTLKRLCIGSLYSQITTTSLMVHAVKLSDG